MNRQKASGDSQVEGDQVKRSIHAVSFLVLLTWLLLASTGICIAGEYQVSRVLDGDTIVVVQGSGKLIIRLVGIDAPEISHKKYEPGQPFGQQSTKYLAGLVLNKVVDVKSYGPDRYGRTLGEVFLDDKNINL
jgi:micrococcal nuclease